MHPVLLADAVRRTENAHRAAHPADDLMARAAAVLARHIQEMLGDPRRAAPGLGDGAPRRTEILIVAGKGNNAGDALFAAGLLPPALAARVRALLVHGTTHSAGLAAFREAGAALVTEEEALGMLPRTALLIDAVAGLGSRPLEGIAAQIAARAQKDRIPVLSVDLPSGLRADAASADGNSFHARRTVCMVALTRCLVQQPAASRAGDVRLEDLGVRTEGGVRQLVEDDLPPLIPVPGPMDHKYTRGVVGFDTGSDTYPGAAVLGAAGALFTGTGMVRHVGSAAHEVVRQFPSVVPATGRVQAWVCGSGWDVSIPEDRAARRQRLQELIDDGRPMVLDAGALDVLPKDLPANSLLTPHAGELARIMGRPRAQIEESPIDSAIDAARELGAVILLKGATQVVADPEGRALIALRGPSWTAQAGSGDVLAGSCGALLAAGVPALEAGALAASLQAITAADHPGPLPPDHLAQLFPGTVSRWAARGEVLA